MKSMCYIAALTVLFSIAGVATAIAGSPKNVVVTNNTTYTMTEFFASSSDSSSDWNTDPSQNLLQGQTVAPGQQATVSISGGGDDDDDDNCRYDLMGVLFGTTQAAYSYSVNTCGGGSWTISGL